MQNKYIKNKRAESAVVTAIKVLTAVVLGALLLVNLYGLISFVIIPSAEASINSMYSYKDEFNGSAGENTGNNTPDNSGNEEQNAMSYYSSLRAAVNDVNAGTAGVNSDATETSAAAALYTDDEGNINIKMLANADETSMLNFSEDVILDINGRTISFTGCTLGLNVKNGANVVINGTADGSTVMLVNDSGVGALVQNNSSTLQLNGGTYTSTASSVACGINNNSGANTYTDGISLTVTSKTGEARGVSNNDTDAKLYTTSTYIYSTILDPTKSSYGIYNYGYVKLNSSTIVGDMVYPADADIDLARAIGLRNSTTAVIENCNIYGVGYGTNNLGEGARIYVNGGDYASGTHGAFYFSHGSTGKAYVKNAVVGNKYMGVYDEWHTYYADSDNVFGKIYIGGSSNSYCSNMSVHLDNINFAYGNARAIVLRDTSGETNNSVYISNTVNTTVGIRADNDSHKIYVGAGCDDTTFNVLSREGDATDKITYTSDTYVIDDSNIPTSAIIAMGGTAGGDFGEIID